MQFQSFSTPMIKYIAKYIADKPNAAKARLAIHAQIYDQKAFIYYYSLSLFTLA